MFIIYHEIVLNVCHPVSYYVKKVQVWFVQVGNIAAVIYYLANYNFIAT